MATGTTSANISAKVSPNCEEPVGSKEIWVISRIYGLHRNSRNVFLQTISPGTSAYESVLSQLCCWAGLAKPPQRVSGRLRQAGGSCLCLPAELPSLGLARSSAAVLVTFRPELFLPVKGRDHPWATKVTLRGAQKVSALLGWNYVH